MGPSARETARARLDGTMNWAYVHYQTGPIDLLRQDQTWALVFRTDDGVLDTLHWEGYREGVDDTRYLATLMKAIKTAPAVKKPDASAAQKWLDGLDITGDLDAIRNGMIEWILKLRT